MNSSSYTFRLANKAYFDKTVQVKPCITQLLKDEIESIDFTNVSTFSQCIFISNELKTELLVSKAYKETRMLLRNNQHSNY